MDPMIFEAILNEVDQLHSVSTRLEELAAQHESVSNALVMIAGSIRNTATILAVLVATKSPKLI
jgi:predicted oxidoreductase